MKAFVRWSLGAMAMLAISGCFVESDNETSEAKYTPDVPKGKMGWLVWIETEEEGYEDVLLMVGLDRKNKRISIRAVTYDLDDSTSRFLPLDDQDCIEHFDNIKKVGSDTIYKGHDGTTFIQFDFDKFRINNLLYIVQDKGGNLVEYKLMTADVPSQYRYIPYHLHSDLWGSEGLLDNGEDCDHVSQSGEEGSVAP